MGELAGRCPGCKRKSCSGCGIYQKLNTNKNSRISFPKDYQTEEGEGLGISFDVGTTTIAGMLWDLKTGTLLGVETDANPQAVFGADVIRRLQAAAADESNLERLQELLKDCLDKMARRLFAESGLQSGAGGERIKKVVCAGNPAMCELLLGITPTGLCRAPFAPDYNHTIRQKGKTLGFEFLGDSQIVVLPPVGGYVGADALMVYRYLCQDKAGERILAVDIGTNGEILLKWGETSYACSAAAGPALEGGAVSQGMRAAAGAVDMVSVSGRFPMEDIAVRVIGAAAPVGICGSGLVDALAVLYRIGVLEHTGYMRSRREAKEAGAPEKISRRIEEGGSQGEERRFLLTDLTSPVYLTAGDVRQLQLSISAIRAGIEILLEKAGGKAEQLDRFYLSGAFGCYIGIESGIQIGLFPDLPREKMIQAGNLAGTGAAMVLLSEKMQRQAEKEKEQLCHVELAGEKKFRELFFRYMNFPCK